MNTEIVKKRAVESGADLVGIAPIDRFQDLINEENPSQIKPNTKSVIVLGFQILRGSLRGIETGSAWGTYGTGVPLSTLTEATYQFCRILENEGWETVPLLSQNKELRNQGIAVSQDKPEPDIILDLDYAAYAAGLGHIGEGKFFLTPEYGPRQLFSAILTDVELEPDPIFNGSVCDGCGECLKSCPANAYDEKSWQENGTFRWRPLHIESCKVCKTGISAHHYCSIESEPNRIGAACGRACVAHLEDSGKLKREFKNPFRTAEKI